MASARARLKVVTLTEAAAARVREIMSGADRPIAGLRVGVKNGGCAGQEYVLEYAAEAGPLDEVVEDQGVTILIEPKAVLFLLGTEMDYKTDIAKYTGSINDKAKPHPFNQFISFTLVGAGLQPIVWRAAPEAAQASARAAQRQQELPRDAAPHPRPGDG